MIYVGIDWAEAHHDACVMDEAGTVLATGRVPEGVKGLAKLHEMVADPCGGALRGRRRDRDRPGTAGGGTGGHRLPRVRDQPDGGLPLPGPSPGLGAKSDPGDAKVLADLVRTDRHNHREVAGDSELAEAIKVLARAHQRHGVDAQRQTNQLRSTLREFYPAALGIFDDLSSADAVAVLALAPTPRARTRAIPLEDPQGLGAGRRRRSLKERTETIYEGLRTATAAGAGACGRGLRFQPWSLHGGDHREHEHRDRPAARRARTPF